MISQREARRLKKYIEVDAAPAREDQRESSEGRTEGSQSLGSNPAPTSGQSKTGLTESHSGAPTQDADELLREAKQHEGRGDDCGRLARLVISYLSRRQG